MNAININKFKLQFITNETATYSHFDSAKMALEAGIRWIQLRVKNAKSGEIEKLALEIKKSCHEYEAIFIINDYVEICKEIGADGVHLGKHDMKPIEARNFLNLSNNNENKFIIGGTANTFEDITELSAQYVDYIGLGPFRFTLTKDNLSPILGLEKYTHITEKNEKNGITIPIVAIGGITKEDIPNIMQISGISGIAMSSSILNADNSITEAKEAIDIMNSHSAAL